MQDWTKRLAMSALFAFWAFVFALPVSCGALVLYSEHLYGDVERGGVMAVLGGMGFSAAVALGVFAWVWWRSGR